MAGLASGITILLLAACGTAEPAADVVLVVIDTLRADRTTALAPGLPTTPHLQALGERALTYRTAVSPSSWTLPAMAALFSGREVTARRTAAFEDVPSLAERFAAAGYRTIGIVANPLLTADNGFDRGFEHYVVAPPESTSLRSTEQALRQWDGRAVVTRALAALEDAPADRPVFLYLHLMDPHLPYDTAHKHRVGGIDGWSMGPRSPGSIEVVWTEQLSEEQQVLMAGWRRAYDGQVSYADAAVGRLLAGLPPPAGTAGSVVTGASASGLGGEPPDGMAAGILRSRVDRGRPCYVAITADHGEGLFSHAQNPDRAPGDGPLGMAYDDHGEQLFEEAVRVPLWLAGPGLPAGRLETRPVDTKHVGDTLLALVGAARPVAGGAGSPGAGVGGARRATLRRLPLTDGDAVPEALLGVGSRGWFVRTAEHKLIVPFPERERHEGVRRALYSVGADAFHPETQDLTAEQAEVAGRLGALFEQWCQAHPQVPQGDNDPATEERLRQLGYTK